MSEKRETPDAEVTGIAEEIHRKEQDILNSGPEQAGQLRSEVDDLLEQTHTIHADEESPSQQ